MYNTTYLAQANILNGVAEFACRPAFQDVIEMNNQVASMVSPFIEMRQWANEMCQPIQNMTAAFSTAHTIANEMPIYNIADNQAAQILSKWKEMDEICQKFNFQNMTWLQTINEVTAIKANMPYIQSMNATIGAVSQYQSLYDTLATVPNTFYDEILVDTEYEKEDILESIEEFTEFIDTLEEDVETGESIEEAIDRRIREFYEKHPVCFILIQIISILLTVGGAISTCEDVYLPMAQEAIIRSEGNEDIYFTKVNIARVYELPDCHSKQVGKLFYGERMKRVKDINMWLKVKFIDKDGNEYTGWVAKRNLIDYQTWKYNSDSLYTMGD